MSPKVINIITNIIGALLVILEPVRAYLLTQEFNWVTFIVCILAAIVAWFTGKSGLYKPNE